MNIKRVCAIMCMCKQSGKVNNRLKQQTRFILGLISMMKLVIKTQILHKVDVNDGLRQVRYCVYCARNYTDCESLDLGINNSIKKTSTPFTALFVWLGCCFIFSSYPADKTLISF